MESTACQRVSFSAMLGAIKAGLLFVHGSDNEAVELVKVYQEQFSMCLSVGLQFRCESAWSTRRTSCSPLT